MPATTTARTTMPTTASARFMRPYRPLPSSVAPAFYPVPTTGRKRHGMAAIKRLCVYCASSRGVQESYRSAAVALGTSIADAGIELVYGGGRVGLMGLIADAALARNGRVTGVIPGHLHDREVAHPNARLVVVASMHERKQRMFDLADAFVALPGGLGTLDETIEIVTWKQLGLHDKPIVILDIERYWAPL